MKIFDTGGIADVVRGKFVFLDNNFLYALSSDELFFQEAIARLKTGFLTIDPFVGFEFLRDVFDAKQRAAKEGFIGTSLFDPAVSQGQVIQQVMENALQLSKVYAFKCGKMNCDTIDLLLAARVMLHNETSVLITANKAHFPKAFFETLGIICYESEKDQAFKNFYILRFERSKFEQAMTDLQKMDSKK